MSQRLKDWVAGQKNTDEDQQDVAEAAETDSSLETLDPDAVGEGLLVSMPMISPSRAQQSKMHAAAAAFMLESLPGLHCFAAKSRAGLAELVLLHDCRKVSQQLTTVLLPSSAHAVTPCGTMGAPSSLHV